MAKPIIQMMFVCDGNTCRSPMCMYVMRKKLNERGLNVKVISRGLNADNDAPINPNAGKALKDIGVRVGNFKSKRIEKKDVDKSNLIITMNKRAEKLFNSVKVFSADEIIGCEISDPYGKEQKVYNETLSLIEKMCDRIIKELQK